jgi:hypothetical protein
VAKHVSIFLFKPQPNEIIQEFFWMRISNSNDNQGYGGSALIIPSHQNDTDTKKVFILSNCASNVNSQSIKKFSGPPFNRNDFF